MEPFVCDNADHEGIDRNRRTGQWGSDTVSGMNSPQTDRSSRLGFFSPCTQHDSEAHTAIMSLPVASIIRTALTAVLAVSRKEDHAASASCTPEQQLLLIRRQILTATERHRRRPVCSTCCCIIARCLSFWMFAVILVILMSRGSDNISCSY
jgi:hypothetical protein